MFKGKVRGFKEIQAKLELLKGVARKEVVQKVLHDVARPMAETAASICPRSQDGVNEDKEALISFVRSPLVQRRIREGVPVTQLTGKSKGQLREMASRRGDVHLADQIRAYDVPAAEGKVRVIVSYPKGFFRGHFLEWGTVKMPAQPFLRPAWDAHKEDLLHDFSVRMWARMKAALRRQGA